MLNYIKDRHCEADSNRNRSLEKVKQKHQSHIEKVMDVMQKAQSGEQERFEIALSKTQDKKMTFLRRLELQEKDRADRIANSVALKNDRARDVKDRLSIEKKRMNR